MSFTDRFLPFVCEGDTISCLVDGFDIIARIVTDDCLDAPDQRQDGFWPSMTASDAGFIGPGKRSRERFAEAQAQANAVMNAWKAGNWFYCGIVLSVSVAGIELDAHAASLWGIEANLSGDESNSFLTETANELLPEALAAGREALARLIDGEAPIIPRVKIIVSGGVVQEVIVTNGRAEIIIDDRDHTP
jgi:hypothetical protein